MREVVTRTVIVLIFFIVVFAVSQSLSMGCSGATTVCPNTPVFSNPLPIRK